MSTSTSITQQAIAAALKAKAQDAYGAEVNAPFTVGPVQAHKADITYTVTSGLSCQLSSRQVTRATAELYDLDYLNTALEARQQLLLSNPAHFRPMIQEVLAADVTRFTSSSQCFLTADAQCYCTRENCHTCAGHGAVYCAQCAGHGRIDCLRCRRSGQELCAGCHGSGVYQAARYCSYCRGSGTYGNHRCSCGTGVIPAVICGLCAGVKTQRCVKCHGSGAVDCGACHQGQVRCGTCDGACQLLYEYHLDVYVQFHVHYTWYNVTGDWLGPAIDETVRSGPRDAVFAVDHYQLEHVDPRVFTANGHVVAAEASVTHEGYTGTCRFIGPILVPVHLDGVLSGGFKQVLAAAQDHTDIPGIDRASSSKIARQLIAENEQQVPVDETTPVRKGIIDAGDALEFLHKRADAFGHVIATRHRFRLDAVLRFSLPLTLMLFGLYLVTGLFSGVAKGGSGALGIIALLSDPGAVLSGFAQQLSVHLDQLFKGRFAGTLCWFLAAMLFNRFALPLLFPRAWAWSRARWSRRLSLALPGMLLLSGLIALYPAGFVLLDWVYLYMNFNRLGLVNTFTATLYLLPQIVVLAVVLSLIRFRAAGTHWARRMMKILLKRDVADLEDRLL